MCKENVHTETISGTFLIHTKKNSTKDALTIKPDHEGQHHRQSSADNKCNRVWKISGTDKMVSLYEKTTQSKDAHI